MNTSESQNPENTTPPLRLLAEGRRPPDGGRVRRRLRRRARQPPRLADPQHRRRHRHDGPPAERAQAAPTRRARLGSPPEGDGWTLTDEGRAAKDRLGTLVDGIRAKVSSAVSNEEMATTLASLEKIARAFGWDEETPLPRGRRHGFGGPRHGRGFPRGLRASVRPRLRPRLRARPRSGCGARLRSGSGR